MSVKAMNWAWDQTTGNQTDKSVLLCLADWASDHGKGQGHVLWHAQETIAQRAECSKKTVERALDRLQANGFIERSPRYNPGKNGGRTSDLIVLCLSRENGLTDNLSDKGLTDNLSDLNRQFDRPYQTDCRGNLKSEPKKRTKTPPTPLQGDASASAAPEEFSLSGQEEQKTGSRRGPSFEDFWKPYPNKKGKARSQKLWPKLSADDRVAAIAGIEPYMKTDKCKRGFIKEASSYLRDRVWDDDHEIVEETVKTNVHQAPRSNERDRVVTLENGDKRFGTEWKPFPLIPMLVGATLNAIRAKLEGATFDDVAEALERQSQTDEISKKTREVANIVESITGSVQYAIRMRANAALKAKRGHPEKLCGGTPHPDFKSEWVFLSREFVDGLLAQCPDCVNNPIDRGRTILSSYFEERVCLGEYAGRIFSNKGYGADLQKRVEDDLTARMLVEQAHRAKQREWHEKAKAEHSEKERLHLEERRQWEAERPERERRDAERVAMRRAESEEATADLAAIARAMESAREQRSAA